MGHLDDELGLEAFARSILALVRRVRAEAPGTMRDLSQTQRAVMMRLETEGPLIAADLARGEGISPQSMGSALASLETLSLVVRRPHPTDGRQFLFALSREGKAVRKATREAKEGWLTAALARLTQQERDVLRRASKIMERMAQRENVNTLGAPRRSDATTRNQ